MRGFLVRWLPSSYQCSPQDQPLQYNGLFHKLSQSFFTLETMFWSAQGCVDQLQRCKAASEVERSSCLDPLKTQSGRKSSFSGSPKLSIQLGCKRGSLLGMGVRITSRLLQLNQHPQLRGCRGHLGRRSFLCQCSAGRSFPFIKTKS